MTQAVILSAARTPVGKHGGGLASVRPDDLAAIALREAVSRAGITVRRDVPRPLFLGLMREAAVLVGNSSSGIIEAASFGTPVVDVGPRQAGRERSGNVAHVDFDDKAITAALQGVWNHGRPKRSRARNVYGGDGAGPRIATALADIRIDDLLLRKLIAY